MKPTVLIIEDDKSYRTLLHFQVKMCGFNVIEATDGSVGVKMASIYSPVLIISDFNMPSMNGGQVWLSLQQDPQLRRIPFVILSALIDEHWGHHQHEDLYALEKESLREGSILRLLAKGSPAKSLFQLLRELLGSLPMDTEANTVNNLDDRLFGVMGFESPQARTMSPM